MSGAYKACFSNEFSTFSHKLVYMDFRVSDQLLVGEHVTVMTQVIYMSIIFILYVKYKISYL